MRNLYLISKKILPLKDHFLIPQDSSSANGLEEKMASATLDEQKPKKKRKPRKKPTGAEEGQDETTRPKRAPRPPKKVRSPDEPLSDTLVFVGNLPFQVSSEDLKDIFAGFGVVNARVVTFGTDCSSHCR
jgi:RNA recognition motif-containing protein